METGKHKVHSGAKRKRTKSSTDDAPDHGVAEKSAAEKKSKRAIKGWKRSSAGAQSGGDGKYVHSWNEHRRDRSFEEFKYGKWTDEEDRKLLEAFDEYCLMHGLTGDDRIKPVLESIAHTKIHDCWLELAAHFKHRTVRSVLRRAIRLIHPGNFRGDWEDADYRQLFELVASHGLKWKEIGRVMNRLPNSVRNTYYRMAGPDGRMVNTGIWNSEEEEKLVAAVKRFGAVGDNGWIINIPWAAVAAEVKSRSVSQCLQKWTGGFGAKALNIAWDPTLDKSLADAIYDDGGETYDEVYWDRLLPGRTAAECRKRFDVLCKQLPHHAQKTFTGLVMALKKRLDEEDAVMKAGFAAAYCRRKGLARDDDEDSVFSEDDEDADDYEVPDDHSHARPSATSKRDRMSDASSDSSADATPSGKKPRLSGRREGGGGETSSSGSSSDSDSDSSDSDSDSSDSDSDSSASPANSRVVNKRRTGKISSSESEEDSSDTEDSSSSSGSSSASDSSPSRGVARTAPKGNGTRSTAPSQKKNDDSAASLKNRKQTKKKKVPKSSAPSTSSGSDSDDSASSSDSSVEPAPSRKRKGTK